MSTFQPRARARRFNRSTFRTYGRARWNLTFLKWKFIFFTSEFLYKRLRNFFSDQKRTPSLHFKWKLTFPPLSSSIKDFRNRRRSILHQLSIENHQKTSFFTLFFDPRNRVQKVPKTVTFRPPPDLKTTKVPAPSLSAPFWGRAILKMTIFDHFHPFFVIFDPKIDIFGPRFPDPFSIKSRPFFRKNRSFFHFFAHFLSRWQLFFIQIKISRNFFSFWTKKFQFYIFSQPSSLHLQILRL